MTVKAYIKLPKVGIEMRAEPRRDLVLTVGQHSLKNSEQIVDNVV